MKPRPSRIQIWVAECPGAFLSFGYSRTTCLQPQACLPMKRHSAHERHGYCDAAAVSLVTSVFETSQGPMMDVKADYWFRQFAIFKHEVFIMKAKDRAFTIFYQGVQAGRVLELSFRTPFSQLHCSTLSSVLQCCILLVMKVCVKTPT